ncbi:MAG: aminoacyl-tRNA hydrolase [Pseudomonadales bacterium]|nr:aminoacyl-tRNA hydrolase [Candidatus Woesebacteria bacterium]MCB9801806.1 aminoacyl-tRNA hydrolase [Pseudomonadales bacterium]
MKYAIGLGNPGKQYENTRHNVGFMAVEYIQKQLDLPQFKTDVKRNMAVTSNNELTLLKPQSYMNNSGEAVQNYLSYYNKEWHSELEHFFVIHDDLDIPVGSYKVQQGTGPKVHNGLLSLYQHLGTKDFWHIRVGVDGRNGQRGVSGNQYVLSPFLEQERLLLLPVFQEILEQLH